MYIRTHIFTYFLQVILFDHCRIVFFFFFFWVPEHVVFKCHAVEYYAVDNHGVVKVAQNLVTLLLYVLLVLFEPWRFQIYLCEFGGSFSVKWFLSEMKAALFNDRIITMIPKEKEGKAFLWQKMHKLNLWKVGSFLACPVVLVVLEKSYRP